MVSKVDGVIGDSLGGVSIAKQWRQPANQIHREISSWTGREGAAMALLERDLPEVMPW